MVNIPGKSKSLVVGLGLACMLGLSGQASAAYMADITSTFVDNGGNNFTFKFTVANTSTGADTGALDFFEVQFDADDQALYSNVVVLANNDWQSFAFENDPAPGGLPGGASFDAFQAMPMLPGIAQGASLGGFEVSFDYAGSLFPTEQEFYWAADFGTNFDGNGEQINSDPDVWILGFDEGITRTSTSIPEPTTILLFGSGLVVLAGSRRKQRVAGKAVSLR